MHTRQPPGKNVPFDFTDAISVRRDTVAIIDPSRPDSTVADTVASYGQARSLFGEHLMKPGPMVENVRLGRQTDWVFGILLLVLLIITSVRYYRGKKFAVVFQAVFSKSGTSKLLKEESIFRDRILLPLFLVFLISFSTFLFLVFNYYKEPGTFNYAPVTLFGIISGFYFSFFLLKIFLVRISGWIFLNQALSTEYIHNMFIFNIFTGIVLMPLMLLMVYTDTELFLHISLGFLLIIYIYRFIRGMMIGFTDRKFSVLHLFLYLCSLEILPIIVVTKMITDVMFTGA